MINITKDQFNELKKSKEVFPFVLESNGDELTPINIFYSLSGKNRCLLESVGSENEGGRYSFIGVDPYLQLNSTGKNITMKSNNGEAIETEGDVLEAIKDVLQVKYNSLGLKIPFCGGGIGYVGYDVIRQYEKLPDNNVDEIKAPEAAVLFYKTIICYDHYRHNLSLVYNVHLDDTNSYEEIEQVLEGIDLSIRNNQAYHPLPKIVEEKEIKTNLSEQQYCTIVEAAKEYIRKGDIFQAVLSQRFSIKAEGEPFDIYRRLRSSNPSPYLFYIEFDGFQVIGSSPESLVSVYGDVVTTNPIAGTRPRGKTDEEDKAYAAELLKDEKEIAEHVMLVDLGRNDIGRISEFGSVKLGKFMEVGYYSHVMHIVSTVSGRLKKGLDCYDALRVCLPAGTVSGAPKIRAMEIIDELENVRRGIYSGALGYFSYNGNMDTCIAIRTVVVKDNTAYLQAGAGIVYDSDPAKEYIETLNKAKALKEVI